jgi:hypothetical protein
MTRDTSVFRSGVASYKHVVGAAGTFAYMTYTPLTFVDGNTYYMRIYVNVAVAPTAAPFIMSLGGSINDPSIALNTTGKLQMYINSSPVSGASVASIADGAWHRVELQAVAGTGTWTSETALLDGTQFVTTNTVQTRTNGIIWGVEPIGAPNAGFTFYSDDIAVNDSTGANNNTYPGSGSVVLLSPTADSAVGTGWVTGAGGSTSLFDAVNGTPPEGVADTGTATSQIRNATSNATSYDATMTTYTAAGVGVGATVNAILPVTATAAPVTTSSKQGTVGVVSNPAITNVALGATGTAGAFWSGLAGGTYGAGWKWSFGTMTEAPTVTLGTAPVMRVTNSTASTRIADVCSMGIYVDYTAAVAVAPTPDIAMARFVT